MRLESSVNLLVAALDLKLVQLVRGAMRAADAQGGPGADRLIVPTPVIEPRRRFHPGAAIEPRPHVRPEPRIEPRATVRPDNIEAARCQPTVEVAPADKKSSASPIQPPWKVLPWETPPAERSRPVHKVKVVIGPPDMCSRGNVIDLFI